jgi:nucleotide-binding universal stress UspA family protein
MNEFKKILVALAFAGYSKGIFAYAAELAQKLNAELIVASVINERDVTAVSKIVSLGYDVDAEHYVKDIRQERETMLRKFAQECSYPVDQIKIITTVGNPVEELLKMIIREKIDMIVMGLKGRTDLEHIFAGSVADKIFHQSPVTVVSYRGETHAQKLRKRIHVD